MEGFQNSRHEHTNGQFNAQVPDTLLPAVLQRLGLENTSHPSLLQLQSDLHSPDWHRRVAAIHRLAKSEMQAASPLLIAALDDEDATVRAAALHALGEHVPLERLLAALHDTDWHVRETAIFMSGKLKQTVSPELLAPALHDTDSSVRAAAQLAQPGLSARNQPVQRSNIIHMTFDQLSDTSTHANPQGQRMQLPTQQPSSKTENTSYRPLQKKDKEKIMQEQEHIRGQHSEQLPEYNYYDGYRDDTFSRWEKATSYPSPRRPFFRTKRGLATILTLSISGLMLFALMVGVFAWTVIVHKVAVIPTLKKPIAIITDAPTSAAKAPTPTAAIYTYHGHSSSVYDVAWSPNGTRVASASEDGTVQVWDALQGTNVVVHRSNLASYSTLAWSPDGQYIASAAADNPMIEVWNALTGKTVFTYQLQGAAADISHIGALSRLSGGCNTGVYNLAWSPDGTRLLATGGYQSQGLAEMFDVKSGSLLLTYRAHPSCISAVSWSHDGKYIATGSFDGTLNVWDANTGHTLFAYASAGTNVMVESISWSPDNQHIALALWGQGLHIWSPFQNMSFAFDSSDNVSQLAWSPDGGRVASASTDRTVHIWDAHNGTSLYIYQGHTDEVFTVAWSPNGKLLASAGMDNTVQVWQAG